MPVQSEIGRRIQSRVHLAFWKMAIVGGSMASGWLVNGFESENDRARPCGSLDFIPSAKRSHWRGGTKQSGDYLVYVQNLTWLLCKWWEQKEARMNTGRQIRSLLQNSRWEMMEALEMERSGHEACFGGRTDKSCY